VCMCSNKASKKFHVNRIHVKIIFPVYTNWWAMKNFNFLSKLWMYLVPKDKASFIHRILFVHIKGKVEGLSVDGIIKWVSSFFMASVLLVFHSKYHLPISFQVFSILLIVIQSPLERKWQLLADSWIPIVAITSLFSLTWHLH
jgi:hypothetical protein